MNVLGIGMPELIFVILVALIILGPKDMQKTGKAIGGFLLKIVKSSEWRLVKDTTRTIRTLPSQFMREASQDLERVRDDVDLTVSTPGETVGSETGERSTPPFRHSRPGKTETIEIVTIPQSTINGNDVSA